MHNLGNNLEDNIINSILVIGSLCSFSKDFLTAYYDSGTGSTVIKKIKSHIEKKKQDRKSPCSHRTQILVGE